MSTIKLYGTPLSGHAHRVALLLRMLDLPYEWVEAAAAMRQSAAFRRLNPFGQIPVLQDGELTLADSNAILVYLVKRYAPGSHWLPEQPLAAAQVQEWLSKAAGEVRYGPASCRLIAQFSAPEDYQAALAINDRFLPQMERHLGDRQYLATERPTIADLACHSYLAVAAEGGVSLAPYPAIQRWIARIAALPGFFAMPALPEPAAS
ncbi:glutathione S-transferase [Serratia ficaria]|uniref:Glutathione S-transferase GstB n=1 Tax=Serratia ficaria TaxID=61651 RepID=A0A240C4U3_SERFI|nr:MULTISPECIES: glutathione S-transferase [Serratia]MEE4481592.1 glutathione S-transferase [Serratia ficaria]REF44093.1 glutathione S-transferase [Serratia ficaria]CAI0738451.1 Glutathione S-transferase GstB [Serratia ficaria]CAI0742445.1 Glutathione S-transferase GstB [Serratia ficaria]CAI0758022.1 Glutathione S-transferase GstB [Serratia ficaria]